MPKLIRIAAASALIVSAGTAMAADLPARVAPPPYIAPLPIFTWTGFYVGINGGAAFDNREEFTTTRNTAAGIRNTKFSDDGFSAGGQIGYNYQFGGFAGGGIVVGLEADAMYMDTDKSINVPGTGVGAGANTRYESGLNFLGTARGRVGYAFNQFLIYGTGGFAYGNVDSKVVSTSSGNTILTQASKSGFNTGYVYGGGVEYALPTTSFLNFFHASAVTVKAEYLRYNLDSTNLNNSTTVNLPAGLKVKNDGNLARIGLNYKF